MKKSLMRSKPPIGSSTRRSSVIDQLQGRLRVPGFRFQNLLQERGCIALEDRFRYGSELRQPTGVGDRQPRGRSADRAQGRWRIERKARDVHDARKGLVDDRGQSLGAGVSLDPAFRSERGRILGRFLLAIAGSRDAEKKPLRNRPSSGRAAQRFDPEARWGELRSAN